MLQGFALSSALVAPLSPLLHSTLPEPQPLCQGLWTVVDNGGDEDEDIYSLKQVQLQTLHMHCGLKSIAAELVKMIAGSC